MGRKGKSGAPKAARWQKPVAGILLAGASLVSILALAYPVQGDLYALALGGSVWRLGRF